MADAPGTRVVRAGLPAGEDETPFLPGPTFVAPYHFGGRPQAGVDGGFRKENWKQSGGRGGCFHG